MIIQFPSSSALAIRIERERDGEAWLVRTHDREFGLLHGGFNAALLDANLIADSFGVSVVVSSAGVLSCR
jgi:acyl-coenzyme A thioesterase PaaI-like protein